MMLFQFLPLVLPLKSCILISNKNNRYYTWGLFILLTFLLLFRIQVGPIYILDEAKNAECAREMWQLGNYIVPTFNGELRTDKPPLHYFFMAAAYSIFGDTAFAARFFSAIMGVLTVLITFLATKKFIGEMAAYFAALALVVSPHFLFEFRLSVPDPYLIFFIAAGLFSAFVWLEQKKIAFLYLSAVSLALAILAKGPVAIALPGLCLLVYAALYKKWKTLFSIHLIPAALLLLLIAAPWYYLVDQATAGEWTRGFFIDNNINRFSDPQEGHGGFFLLTVIFFSVGLLPFIVYSGEILKNRKQVFSNQLVRFSLIVVIVFLVFFSLASTKLPNYAMPCYPFAAIVIGYYLNKLSTGMFQNKNYPVYILFVFGIVLSVAGFFAINSETATEGMGWIAFFLLVMPVILLFGLKRNQSASIKIKTIVIAFSLFNLIGLSFIYPALYQQNPVAKTLDIVKKSDHVLGFQIVNPGYRFYLDKNIPRTTDPNELKRWIDSTGKGIVITRKDQLQFLEGLPLKEVASEHDLFELPTTVILKYDASPQ